MDAPITHTVVRVDPSDPLFHSIMHGRFQPLTNTSYRDQDGHHFQVFQTTDDATKFIYAADNEKTGALVPLKILAISPQFWNRNSESPSPVKNPYSGIPSPTRHGLPKINAAFNTDKVMGVDFANFEGSEHILGLPNGDPYGPYNASFQPSQFSHAENAENSGLQDFKSDAVQASYPVKIEGMRRFLMEAISTKMKQEFDEFPNDVEGGHPSMQDVDENGNFNDYGYAESYNYAKGEEYSPKSRIEWCEDDRNEEPQPGESELAAAEPGNEVSHGRIHNENKADTCVQCSPSVIFVPKSDSRQKKVTEKILIQTAEDLSRVLNVELDFPSLVRVRRAAVVASLFEETSQCPQNHETAHTKGNATTVASDVSKPEKLVVQSLPSGLRNSFALRCDAVLSTLVLRRVADDYLLEVIGKTLSGLKHLDVTGSPDVTNLGIRLLFIKAARENSSLCHMSSWIHKNLHIMNPVLHTLQFLDFSYTQANFYSRRLVSILPGALAFHRIFRKDEADCFGHYEFYRGTPDIKSQIGAPTRLEFETQLRKLVGPKAAIQFLKFTETHTWRRCHVTLRDVDMTKKLPMRFQKSSLAYITPSEGDHRVLGQVVFHKNHIVGLYSTSSMEVASLFQVPIVQELHASITGTWTKKFTYLDHLTKLNAIVEPSLFMSFITHCPRLENIRVRLRNGTLTDQDLVGAVQSSDCRHHLRQLSLVPSYIKPTLVSMSCPLPKCKKSATVSSSLKLIANLDEEDLVDGYEIKRGEWLSDCSCKLSINAAKALLWCCPVLWKLGNLAGWTEVIQEEWKELQESLAEERNGTGHVVVEWNEIVLTDLDVIPDMWEH